MTVGDLLQSVMPRIEAMPPGMTLVDCVNVITGIITKRLVENDSDLVKAHHQFTYAASDQTEALPERFLGISERPYVTTTKARLDPLPKDMRADLATAGTPMYFEVRGANMLVHPPPAASTTVELEFYQKPAAATDITSTIPFSGTFDDLYMEAVLRIGSAGSMITEDPTFIKFVKRQIDNVLSIRTGRRVAFREWV